VFDQRAVAVGKSTVGLTPGTYEAPVLVSHCAGGAVTHTFTLSIGQSIVENGGFRTGDFTGGTLIGNTIFGQGRQAIVYNAVVRRGVPIVGVEWGGLSASDVGRAAVFFTERSRSTNEGGGFDG